MKDHRTRSEIGNRLAKAVRVAGFLTRHLGAVEALELARTAGEAEWSTIADHAGERIPSTATRAAIVAILATAPTARAAVDPFARLGAA